MPSYKNVVIVASGLLVNDRPPPAIAFLAGVCELNNINYEVFDLNIYIKKSFGDDIWEKLFLLPSEADYLEINDKKLLDKIDQVIDDAAEIILSYDPDLIAISVFSHTQYAWTKLILTALKNKSAITIIAGGQGISYETTDNKTIGKKLQEQKLLDYYVNGEGDITFDSFLKNKPELGLNGPNCEYETWVPQLSQLDNLPLPSYKKIEFDDYKLRNDHPAIITITGSRGCVRRCTFCNVGDIWKKFRFRSADDITKEIQKHYLETGISEFHFSDSLINGSLKQFIDLMKNLIILKEEFPDLANLKFSGQFIIRSSNQHPEYMFELMQKSGCHRVEVGVESGSEEVRKHMGKPFTNADLDYHFEMCAKYGIKNGLLLFTGYPTESQGDHQDTLDMLRRYQKYLINDIISFLVLTDPVIFLKGTPLANMQTELGIHLFNGEYGNTLWTADINPELTIEEKYRRFIEATKLTIELGYSRSFNILPKFINHIKMINQYNGLGADSISKFNELLIDLDAND
jgi:radical SAM superfamily enzyme YgiQ (UPF0313 family)